MRHTIGAVLSALALSAALLAAAPAQAGPLPDNCEKVKGTVTCTTFDGPGKNQGGVGTTTDTETQGNTTNTSPDPQELETTEKCKPPTSAVWGEPCTD